MSRLTDEAANEPTHPHKGPRCGVKRIIESFEPDDRIFFLGLLDEVASGARTASSVSRILDRLDIHYVATNISRHLRGDCSCKGDEQ